MTMMPRLQAEEMLARTTATALGAGAMKPAERSSLIRKLERQAGRRRAAKAEPAVLAAMGIKVERV